MVASSPSAGSWKARVDNPHRHHYQWLTPGVASHDVPRNFEERYRTAYADELEAFAACVRDDTVPRVTGYDALAARRPRHGATVAAGYSRDADAGPSSSSTTIPADRAQGTSARSRTASG